MIHSVTNYELHKGLYSGHNDHNYFEIAHTIRREFDANGGIYRGLKLYSFVDNHDVNRIFSKLNVKGHLKPVHALLYFLPGIPSVYYGSEFGIEGRKEQGGDDALRPAIDLEQMKKDNPHPELTRWIRTLGNIRKKYPDACGDGRYQELLLTNRQYAFARIGVEHTVLTAVNNDEGASAPVSFPVPVEGVYRDALTGETVPAEGGRISLELEPCGCRILVCGRE